MSTIVELMDGIRSAISGQYSDKIELVNREDLASNPDFILANGFDVLVGAATNENELRGRGNAISRTISVILTKRITDSDLQNSSKHATENILLQEMVDIGSLLKTSRLVTSKVLNIEFSGDNGMSVTDTEKIKFLSTTLDFTVRYVEFYN